MNETYFLKKKKKWENALSEDQDLKKDQKTFQRQKNMLSNWNWKLHTHREKRDENRIYI